MTTYNGERYLKEQLDSILIQLGGEDELVISDDGSTDGTIDIIKRYDDPRIKLFHHTKDNTVDSMAAAALRHVSQNIEFAINQSRGEHIFLADQDDVWENDRITIVKQHLIDHDLVLCNHKLINSNGYVINEKYYDKNPISDFLIKNLISIPFLGCCMAVKRSALAYMLPFPACCPSHDNWMGCAAVMNGSCKFIDTPLHRYRRHEANASPATNKKRNTNSLFFKFQYRFSMLISLTLRTLKYKNA
jgi:glycosyltransferase involved in cell wall biosynthesis